MQNKKKLILWLGKTWWSRRVDRTIVKSKKVENTSPLVASHMYLWAKLATRGKTSETMKHNKQQNFKIKDQKHCWLSIVTTNMKPLFSPTIATLIKFLQNKNDNAKDEKKLKWLMQRKLFVVSHISPKQTTILHVHQKCKQKQMLKVTFKTKYFFVIH